MKRLHDPWTWTDSLDKQSKQWDGYEIWNMDIKTLYRADTLMSSEGTGQI
jgi:hypothetical protein